MKFLRLLSNNVLRNRRRSILTVSSIALSLFLITTLRTVLTELENPPETPASALRLITRHRVSLFNSLPKSYFEKIKKLEGVDEVFGSMWFGGIYKEPSNFFANFSIDAKEFFEVQGDIVIPEEQKQAFLADRTGAIAGKNLAERFGWRLGEKIHLKGSLFGFDPELTLRGIYEGGPDSATTLYFHWEYFNQGMNDAGFTGTYTIKATSLEELPRVAERVDALFRNSAKPTKTETERAFLKGFVDMMGNVRFLITSICVVVIFAISLVAANSMAMSIRERVREIGIFKALGFRRRQILLLLLGESVFLALLGASLGSWGARLLYSSVNMAQATGGMLQRFYVTPETLALAALIGLLVGVVAAGVPAWRASRRPVVEALRQVV